LLRCRPAATDFRTSWQPRPTKLRSLHAFRAAHPHPPVGGRGAGRRAAGARAGRRSSRCGKRQACSGLLALRALSRPGAHYARPIT
jgi:hypothetical protein